MNDKIVAAEQVQADAEVVAEKDFWVQVDKSDDLEDNLQGLVDQLCKYSKSTGAYLGKLIFPEKPIDDDADDKDHMDEEAEKVIKFSHATPDHQFMVDAVYDPSRITHQVFRDQSVGEEDEPQLDEDGEPIVQAKTDDILDSFKNYVYIDEVVRKEGMKFQKVPRLGSYIAIPLVYESCLHDDALEAAVADYLDVTQRNEQQEKEKIAYEEEQNQIREQKAAAGEQYEPEEERSWEAIEYAPFQTIEEKYVVCLDTMGQDREFTDEQKRFALETIKRFKESWEKEERDNLTLDRDRKLELMSLDVTYENENNAVLVEEMEKQIEEAF